MAVHSVAEVFVEAPCVPGAVDGAAAEAEDEGEDLAFS